MKKLTMLALAMVALFALAGTSAWAQSSSVTVTLSAQNGSGQNGTAVLQDMGDGTTKVTVNISGGSAVAQPAHIHDGPCATLNPKPKYPLTSLVNGTSETIVKQPLSDLADGTYAINVHKSAYRGFGLRILRQYREAGCSGYAADRLSRFNATGICSCGPGDCPRLSRLETFTPSGISPGSTNTIQSL